MDASEDIDNPCSQISRIFAETDLFDLHHHHYPAQCKPAIHPCGSAPINLVAGTQLLAAALTHPWILLFGMLPLIKGDHRLLGLDFNQDILFGNTWHSPTLGLL